MLNNIGLPGLLLIAIVVLVLFGRGKISSLMGEVGKGITAFKKGVSDGSKEIEDGRDRRARRDARDRQGQGLRRTGPGTLHHVRHRLDRASRHRRRGADRGGSQGPAGHVPHAGSVHGKMRRMARDFQRAMDEAADESGVKQTAADLKTMTSAKNLGLNTLKDAADRFDKWEPPKPAKPAAKPRPGRTRRR
jgi:sec-independent protein translocase protein TatA